MHGKHDDTELLFVYGTLRRGSRHRMHTMLAAAAEFVDTARFQGRLFRVARYPGVTASQDPDDRVVGDVFRLTDPARLLRKLDRYEGCDPRDPQAAYVRETRTVVLGSGDTVTAWVYLYNRSTASLEPIPSGDYFGHD